MSKFQKTFSAVIVALVAVLVIPGLSSCSSKEKRFNDAIEQLNAMLPMNLGNGFTMEKVSSEGDGIIYSIKCDENELDMDMIEQNKQELHDSTLAQLKREKRSNKNFASLLEFCKENNKKIIYRYIGSHSGKTVDVAIEADEI